MGRPRRRDILPNHSRRNGSRGRVEIVHLAAEFALDGRLFGLGTAIQRITTTDTAEATGGADTIEGNAEADIILGGVHGDVLRGDSGDDFHEILAEKPEIFGRTLIYLGLAEGIAIYGLVMSILLLDKI